MSILDGTAEEMSDANAELMAEIARLKAENAALTVKAEAKEKPKKTLTDCPVTVKFGEKEKEYALRFGTGEKGGVCVYGLGKFPVTLFPWQMLALLEGSVGIYEYIVANQDKLSWEKAAVAKADGGK